MGVGVQGTLTVRRAGAGDGAVTLPPLFLKNAVRSMAVELMAVCFRRAALFTYSSEVILVVYRAFASPVVSGETATAATAGSVENCYIGTGKRGVWGVPGKLTMGAGNGRRRTVRIVRFPVALLSAVGALVSIGTGITGGIQLYRFAGYGRVIAGLLDNRGGARLVLLTVEIVGRAYTRVTITDRVYMFLVLQAVIKLLV